MTRQPWHQQEGEPATQFARFDQYYLPQDPASRRTVAEAYRRYQDTTGQRLSEKSLVNWHRVAKRWRWAARAEAYDEHLRQQRYIAEERARAKMLQQHADLGLALRARAHRVLLEWPVEDVIDEDGQVVRRGYRTVLEASPSELRRWAETGVRLEAAARGMGGEMAELVAALMAQSPDEIVADLERTMDVLRRQAEVAEDE